MGQRRSRHGRRQVLTAQSPLEDSLRRFRDAPAASLFGRAAAPANATAAAATAAATQVVECRLQSRPEARDGARGVVRITVRRDVSPAAAAQFLALATSGYYDGVYVFRVLKGCVDAQGRACPDPPDNCIYVFHADPFGKVTPGACRFVAQFGLRPQWAGWSGPEFKRVQEAKPFPPNALSNTRGTVAFAGGSPTQVR